jgi:hypothetical protein
MNPPSVALVLTKLMFANELNKISIVELTEGNIVTTPPVVELVVTFATVLFPRRM